jgi:hypothetical protein
MALNSWLALENIELWRKAETNEVPWSRAYLLSLLIGTEDTELRTGSWKVFGVEDLKNMTRYDKSFEGSYCRTKLCLEVMKMMKMMKMTDIDCWPLGCTDTADSAWQSNAADSENCSATHQMLLYSSLMTTIQSSGTGQFQLEYPRSNRLGSHSSFEISDKKNCQKIPNHCDLKMMTPVSYAIEFDDDFGRLK